MTLRDIMGTLNMPDSILSGAAETHQRFKAAAEAGGGWVEYEWANLNAPGQPSFQKVAYIFSLHRDGIEYYGGAHRTLLRFAVWQLRHLTVLCCCKGLGILMCSRIGCSTWRRAEAKAERQSAARRSTEQTAAKRMLSASSVRFSRI